MALGQSVEEQMLNSLDIMEKHLEHNRGLFKSVTDFKRAFGRVWHVGLWQVLKVST